MSSDDASRAFQQQAERIEALVQQIEASATPEVHAAAQELVRALLDLHGAGLTKLLALLADAGEPGRAIRDACLRDELLDSLLKLHDRHPQDTETRVSEALDSVRPYLQSHGGEVTLLEIREGIVRLRLQGSCNGCPSSSATLRSTIEQAIHEAAPEITAIEAEGESPTSAASGFVQLGLPADAPRQS
ncbi:MAG: NifU family protein [Phycisphaeraceae bacterium]